MTDKLTLFYEYCKSDKCSETIRLQSSLLSKTFGASEKGNCELDKALNVLCTQSSACVKVSHLFQFKQLDKLDVNARFNREKNVVDDALSFADDLSMMTEFALAKADKREKLHVIQHVAPSVVHQIPTATPLGEEKKRNPFATGKDLFIAQGGQIDTTKQTGAKRHNDGTVVSSNNNRMTNSTTTSSEASNSDKALIARIEADIIHSGQPVRFEDISGLDFAKKCVTELICWPMSRPDLFQGLRALPRGLLLFGPPGTGKTLIGKAIAHQSGATFFSISASSLMSKWIGEGEKLVRTLFEVAEARQPAVVFMDEVDSLLCQRSSDENEASRRMKTEFMVQLDGAGTSQTSRVVIVGATNRPEELDEAVRRRFVKRIYIPLPDKDSRKDLIVSLMCNSAHNIRSADLSNLVEKTEGFSGSDIRSLCTEAAMGPVRELAAQCSGNLHSIRHADVPPITYQHFENALESVLPTVSPSDLQRYIDWNASFGSFRRLS